MLSVHPPAVWIGFTTIILALLILDLGVLNRRSHRLSAREAGLWWGGLVLLAAAFAGFLWWREGHGHALEFVTGYIVELSLSVDNLFVFILLFQYFAVPPALQAKVLKWGIFGAIVMRGLMIGLGALLLQKFSFILYLFGAVLVFTGIKMFRTGDETALEPERNPLVGLARRALPFSASFEGDRFFVRSSAGLLATPLLLVLLVVEWTDLLFAIDSIPAIFAVTRDAFIVYSSNIFAILGLRALFFLIAGMLDTFVYLKPGVALILVLIGIKMLLSHWVHVPVALSLAIIVLILCSAVGISLLSARRSPPTTP